MQSLKDDPKALKYNGVLVGIPTFGMNSINFTISMATSASPIFTSKSFIPIVGKPVDVARNEIAKVALDRNYGYVWFRDDDVSTESDALIKLLGRFGKEQKAKPREVAEAIIGGVVYSKVRPPTPMIYRADVVGGYEDWNFGDLVECDTIGMGCTVIPTGVFRKIISSGLDKYQCVNDRCPVGWSVVYETPGYCPHCRIGLCPILFKTVRPNEGLKGDIEMTEDTYFCLQAKEVGVKIYADCAVQTQHECTDTGTMFYFHQGLGCPVWECDGNIEFTPTAGSFIAQRKEFSPRSNGHKKNGNNGSVKFNIGCGEQKKKGYVNIDAFVEADFNCDIRDLGPAVRTYGQADEIFARHVLEHVNRSAIPATVKNWLKALKPGGKLRIETPDGKAAMEEFLYHDSNGSSFRDREFYESVVFGSQERPGMEHMTAITENKMNRLVAANRNMIARATVRSMKPKGYNQRIIRATITKVG